MILIIPTALLSHSISITTVTSLTPPKEVACKVSSRGRELVICILLYSLWADRKNNNIQTS